MGHSVYNLVKQRNNSVVKLTFNFFRTEPTYSIQCLDRTGNSKKDIPCPQIIKAHNKRMGAGGAGGALDLADRYANCFVLC